MSIIEAIMDLMGEHLDKNYGSGTAKEMDDRHDRTKEGLMALYMICKRDSAWLFKSEGTTTLVQVVLPKEAVDLLELLNQTGEGRASETLTELFKLGFTQLNTFIERNEGR